MAEDVRLSQLNHGHKGLLRPYDEHLTICALYICVSVGCRMPGGRVLKTILCLMLVLVFAVSLAADERTEALDGERKLDKLITLSLRAASLKEVLATIEQTTGAHLLLQREIAEDKATVYAKDQPAREVLRALAHCFNLCWSPSTTSEKQYLRLWMDRKYLASMYHREYQDYLSIVDQYEKELRATAECVRAEDYNPPYELMAKIEKENVPEYHRLDRRAMAARNPNIGAMVLQYLALSDKQKEQLHAGDYVVVSGAQISPEALKKWPEAQAFGYTTDRSASGYMLRCGVKPGKVGGTFLISSAYFDNTPYEKEAELTAKQLIADAALDKDLPLGWKAAPEAVIHPGEGSDTVPGTMSDGMLELAQAANIPIVAQYVSEYSGANPNWETGKTMLPTSTARKVGERLAELVRQHTFTIVRDGNFLLGRSLLWHRQRLREVPEAKIRAWQKNACGLPAPTFDAYVDMASMRWEQVRGTIENTRYWFGPQWLIYLARCEYALRIYGALTSEQKQWLTSGAELPVSALTPDQQVCFMSGFEVREKPTFENATERNWPQTASISLRDGGYDSLTLSAAAGMQALGQISPEQGALQIPKDTPPEDVQKVADKLIDGLFGPLQSKLLAQVAKDHPEVPARNVSVYCLRDFVFTLKLGEHSRKCELVCAVKIK